MCRSRGCRCARDERAEEGEYKAPAHDVSPEDRVSDAQLAERVGDLADRRRQARVLAFKAQHDFPEACFDARGRLVAVPDTVDVLQHLRDKFAGLRVEGSGGAKLLMELLQQLLQFFACHRASIAFVLAEKECTAYPVPESALVPSRRLVVNPVRSGRKQR